MSRPVRVSEIFGPTIQGEGAQIGRPTVFVRTGGCDYRCSWCDTPYAVLPEYRDTWDRKTAVDIIDRVEELSEGRPILITLSGGNPAIQPLEETLDEGHRRGHTFTMETQGSMPRDWFAKLDHLCLSPKPPSSGMKTDLDKLDACVAAGPEDTILKIVIFDDDDYGYARFIALRYPDVPMFLQVGNETPVGEASIPALLKKLGWLAEKAVADGWNDARVLPQLHTLIWNNARGV